MTDTRTDEERFNDTLRYGLCPYCARSRLAFMRVWADNVYAGMSCPTEGCQGYENPPPSTHHLEPEGDKFRFASGVDRS